MARCSICRKFIWFWQKRVKSVDKLYNAHRKCKPQGFFGAGDEVKTILSLKIEVSNLTDAKRLINILKRKSFQIENRIIKEKIKGQKNE